MIDAGDIPPDGRLPTERDLSERFRVGRRAVRRALEALAAEGIVWRRQGKGTFVGQPPNPAATLAAEVAHEADPLTVMEARLCVEPSLAELCARRATAADVETMRHLARRTVASADSDAAELWDGSLHRLIARTAGNSLLLTVFSLLDDVRMGEEWRSRRHRARSPERIALYDRQHAAVIDAIEAGDGPGARAAMAAHLTLLAENLRHSLAEAAE